MQEYFPHQRYSSQGEPELGIGLVTKTGKDKVELYFPSCKETRLYAIATAPLSRVTFKSGDLIKDVNGEEMLIAQVRLKGELYIYIGKDREISEAELGDVTISHTVEDRLFMGDVETPQNFALRRETLQHDYKRRLSAVNGFVGGRIDLIPHQLYIAHEVSSRYAPRVLLSDQVGLGKTIEACLILHRMLLNGRISRVIILVPESLIHQWFVELLRRFNLWFNIFDEERCASLDSGAPEGNPFLDDQLILCSTEFIAHSPKRSQQTISAGWDMLVVDEAHHLEWSVDKVSHEYALVEQLCKAAKALLLLTATPEQLGAESHFARLRLLDPNRYSNYDNFKAESSDHKQIADIVEKLNLDKKLLAKEAKLLTALFSKERMDAVAEGGLNAKDQLIEDLLDQHGPGRVLFRNTRVAMKGFPKRKANLIPIEPTVNHERWIELLTEEFMRDMQHGKSTTTPQYQFDEDPRIQWITTTIKELYPQKALLICKSKEKVLALNEALANLGNLKVALFHEDLTIVQRDRNAAWFSESDGAQLLICSEIGSEGRNFQFAHHLILFDLPLQPELLEQRIGRLDRIGQAADIHLHIPYVINTPQQLLAKWFHEGVNAFEENLEGGDEISKTFTPRLRNSFKTDSLSAASLVMEALIQETAQFRKELKIKMSEGRDRLLEMNSFRPMIAQKLVEQIQAADSDRGLESYLTKVFKHFNMEMEDLAHRTYFLQPSSEITETFPSIPREGISVSFDRKRALSREEMIFLSWDHPVTTTAIDMVLSSGTGSASFGVLRGSKSPGLLLEFLFMLETSNEQSIYVDRFLPNTPIRVVVDHTGKEVTESYPTDLLDKQITPGSIESLLDNENIVETILPMMISTAEKIAETSGTKVKAKGVQEMRQTLNHEIERLKSLQHKNKNIRPEELQTAVNELKTLELLIQNARIRMDAIQLILKQ